MSTSSSALVLSEDSLMEVTRRQRLLSMDIWRLERLLEVKRKPALFTIGERSSYKAELRRSLLRFANMERNRILREDGGQITVGHHWCPPSYFR